MHTIKAASYTITVGNNVLAELDSFIASRYQGCSLFVIVDSNTEIHCWPLVQQQVKSLANAKVIRIPSGEPYKNLETCQQVWTELFEGQANRNSVVFNVGGGVVGDLGGFCAATYKRGIRFVNIPTTLLSQVDASVGGKLGVDFNHLKNQIGVFQNPEAVYINTSMLETLSKRQLVSGYAEILKHALIRDRSEWESLRTADLFDASAWSTMVADSVKIKNQVVLEDPAEKGLRKLLNFGHTIGHAVETASLTNDEKPLLHGEAIAIGMIAELYLAKEQLNFSDAEFYQVLHEIERYFPLQPLDETTFPHLVELMKADKKNETSAINFTLLRAIGQGDVNFTATPEAITKALQQYNQVLNEISH